GRRFKRIGNEIRNACERCLLLVCATRLLRDDCEAMVESGLLREENRRRRRVLSEKPFGHDLDSARKRNVCKMFL
ncbi:MAG: hypothetical protein JO313_09815, partial [Verrucomicrobia bacterium]|nr:hypothetical protein [Verrucomicrobiota bacterium]